jgi:hypothetical protein
MSRVARSQVGQWVLLSYRLPRQTSTPRITVWRNLNRLGVGKLNDGLVALPADARTREQLDWVSQQIVDFGGEASIWLASAATLAQEDAVVAAMTADRAGEYQAVIDEAQRASGLEAREVRRIASRLGAELQRIQRRDYFPPPERDRAETAVAALRDSAEATATIRARP